MSYAVPGLPEPEGPEVVDVARRGPGALLGEPFHVLLSRALMEAGLSKGEAARRLGVERGRVTDWTTGRREPGAERGLWIIITLGLDFDIFRPH